MRQQEYERRQIVRRSDEGNSPVPASRENDVQVIGATFWPSHHEATSGDENVEVSLLPSTTALVRDFPMAGLDESWLRHLEQRIVRHPRELVSHVRRVLSLHKLEQTDRLAGALLDLFIVLGPRGRALRSRLFFLIESNIPPAERDFFRAHLEDGVSATDPVPLLPNSRLSRQVAGTTRIVAPRHGNTDGDAYSLALEALANGQNDVAQSLLEDLLELDPGSPDVCASLLDLYEQKRLREDLLRTYTRFLGRQLGHQERWQSLVGACLNAGPTVTPGHTELPDLAWLE